MMDGSAVFWMLVAIVVLIVVGLGVSDDDVIDDVFGRREE